MRIAADTAILVRAHTKAYGPSRELLNIIRESGARLILSPFLVTEIERVLRYPRLQSLYGLSNEEIREYWTACRLSRIWFFPHKGRPLLLKTRKTILSSIPPSLGTLTFYALETSISTRRT